MDDETHLWRGGGRDGADHLVCLLLLSKATSEDLDRF